MKKVTTILLSLHSFLGFFWSVGGNVAITFFFFFCCNKKKKATPSFLSFSGSVEGDGTKVRRKKKKKKECDSFCFLFVVA